MTSLNRLDKIGKRTSPLLACYLPYGDPQVLDGMVDIYAKCGVDIFEIGLPAANPLLDGPTVADSMKRAHQHDPTLDGLAECLVDWRQRFPQKAMILMGYNGEIDTQQTLKKASVNIDGILSLDQDPELQNISWRYGRHPIHRILFLSHALTDIELDLTKTARGYIMLAATGGQTGERAELEDNRQQITQIKEMGVETPILLGIGISTPAHAQKAVEMGADGVVIGSACVRRALQSKEVLQTFLTDVREALDEAN